MSKVRIGEQFAVCYSPRLHRFNVGSKQRSAVAALVLMDVVIVCQRSVAWKAAMKVRLMEARVRTGSSKPASALVRMPFFSARFISDAFHDTPAIPTCETHTTCDGCAGIDDCAWCASEKKCMTVSDIFSRDCRGTVFELPCPASFVAGLCSPPYFYSVTTSYLLTENRVVGNLIVEPDPVFGGGHISASGTSPTVQRSSSSC
jgi:hypothetical protein